MIDLATLLPVGMLSFAAGALCSVSIATNRSSSRAWSKYWWEFHERRYKEREKALEEERDYQKRAELRRMQSDGQKMTDADLWETL